MTPEEAYDLSEKLTRHAGGSPTAGVARNGAGGGSPGDLSPNHSHSHSYSYENKLSPGSNSNSNELELSKQGSISVAEHASNLLSTFTSAFKAGLMVGRSEGGAEVKGKGNNSNNRNNEEEDGDGDGELDMEIGKQGRDKPVLTRTISQ